MQKEYKLIAGKVNKKLKTVNECKKAYAAFSPLIVSIAECIKSNAIGTGEFKFAKDGEKLHLKFSNETGNGEISVEITGLDDELLGTPYYSSWDGLFYRLPNHKKKPFVKNGQFVRQGSPIGVVFVNKNEQFILNAPNDGFIFFPGEDKHLDRGISLRVYDQVESVDSKPVFYLK